MSSYSEGRDWEVNGPEYRTKPQHIKSPMHETTGADFKNRSRFFGGRNLQAEKSDEGERKVNRFLEKKAEYGESDPMAELAGTAGSIGGVGAYIGAQGAKQVLEDTRVQKGLHKDVRAIMKDQADEVRAERLKAILENKGGFAFEAALKSPLRTAGAAIGGSIAGGLAYQGHQLYRDHQEEKSAFAEMREGLEKAAAYFQ